jgi:hypothetical protein
MDQELVFQRLSDADARAVIVKHLQATQRAGAHTVHLLDLVMDLHLPAPQICRVLEELERLGAVTPHGDRD